jgi:hypothetical protein
MLEMEDKIYKITLADGTVLENLTLNGNNFISGENIEASTFEMNCSPVIVSDGTTEEIHENMELVQVSVVEGKTWFVLRDISEDELEQAKIKADIEYIAMMSDIEL